MEQFSTEEQQAEALRKWLRTNGPSILVGVTLGLGLMFGINRWQAYQKQSAENVSLEYSALLGAGGDRQPEALAARAQRLREEHPDSGYAVLAAFSAAEAALADDPADPEAAAAQLRWVADQAPIEGLRELGRLRLARLLLASGDPKAASSLAAQSTSPAFMGLTAEVRGDAALALDDPDAARSAYAEALALRPDALTLRRKLENLGGTPDS